MTTPMEARSRLDELSSQLGELADLQAECDRQLEPVEKDYIAFIDQFEVGLWVQHVDGAKLPPADMRTRLAHQKIDPDLLGKYIGLTNKRKRLAERIASLGKQVQAQISILSALKAEMEGAR